MLTFLDLSFEVQEIKAELTELMNQAKLLVRMAAVYDDSEQILIDTCQVFTLISNSFFPFISDIFFPFL